MGILYIAGALVVGVVGGFVLGFLVYRNNAKKFEAMIGKIEKLPAEKKAQLEEWLKNL